MKEVDEADAQLQTTEWESWVNRNTVFKEEEDI